MKTMSFVAQDSRWRCSFFTSLAIAAILCRPAVTSEDQGHERWEEQITAFEAKDRLQPPPQRGILFIGSSSIRGWKLDDYFADLPVINRGFGGSQIADSTHFADRIITPYKPRIVVLYAGDNDIAKGKSPERVTADYRAFVKTVHSALPKTRIVFIAIKPSISRWKLVDDMRRANASVKSIADKDDRLVFVDIDKPMIGQDGQPRKELFRDDGLHLNAAGYKLWASLVKPHLKLK